MQRLQLTTMLCVMLALAACRPKAAEPEPTSGSQTSASPTPAPDTKDKPATPDDSTKQAAAADPAQHDAVDPKNSEGYQTIHAKTKNGDTELAVKPPEGWQIVQPPTTPDPHNGKFSLAEALAGLKGKGSLVATISTSMGDMQCDLFDSKAPITVANFVGLARGKRKFWDDKQQAWVGRPYYDGLIFHRVIPGFMIQGGDLTGTGGGRMWYMIPDEVSPQAKHDRAGLLCMANRGPNTNEAQFFITEAATPHLDGSYTIFGECRPTEVVYRIARVPQSADNRPLTPVRIEHITVARVEGGAAAHGISAPPGPLPDNKVPGVVPPGRAVRGDRPTE